MKVLNAMEIGMVSGGGDLTCDAPPGYADSMIGIGARIPIEVGNFFAGMNQLGSQLGIWLYNMTHSC